ncbi:MAG: hypothetical protein ACI9C1_002369 [Candidatus Aldehydirespiratoraceae bacterium]
MHHSFQRLLIIVFTSILIATSCSDDVQDSRDELAAAVDALPIDEEIAGDINATIIEVVASVVSPIAARVEVTSEIAVTVQISAKSDEHEVATPITAATATVHNLPLVGMRQNTTYVVAVNLAAADGQTATLETVFTTGEIDDVIPNFQMTNVDPARRSPGITIIETNTVAAAVGNGSGENDFGGNAIVGLDEDDEIVWYWNTDRFQGSVQRTPSGEVAVQNDPFGMTIHAITGEPLRRYYVDPDGSDETTVVDGTKLIPYYADWVELGSIHHDIQVRPDDTIFALSRTVHEIPVARQQQLCPGDEFEWGVTSDVIIHITSDGEVLRTWDLWDISSFDSLPGPLLCQTQGLGISETERDWTHANALWFDESRNALLVSSRHTDQIIALAMTEETGPQTEARWILGADGTIPYDGQSFHHTHGVKTAVNGDILLYDNGNFRPGTEMAGGDEPNYSRGVRIKVDDTSDDPASWSATQVWEHRMVDPLTNAPIFAPIIGDTDELDNGNILVTHGGAVVDPTRLFETLHVHLVEIVPDGPNGGDVVWELRAGDGTQPESTYRADRWESLYFGPLWAED